MSSIKTNELQLDLPILGYPRRYHLDRFLQDDIHSLAMRLGDPRWDENM